MKYLIGSIILGLIGVGFYLVVSKDNSFELITNTSSTFPVVLQIAKKNSPEINPNLDIEPQKPLADPPEKIRGLYLTSWSAGSPEKANQIIDFIENKGLNAVVVDIKDYSGYVAYDTQVPEVLKYNAKEIRIPRINALIKKFHDQGIYVIARITVFQDPVMAKARPDLAIHSRSRGAVWVDRKGLAWLDPASKEVWNYDIAIAKDAASRGFDEINFDYVRFASDGNLRDMKFPFWNGKESKSEVIKNFFKYLRGELVGMRISADLFGLSTVQHDDLGIGQIIENSYPYFDYVSPMVYPSHYAPGAFNFKNPALHPYEVVKYSLASALERLLDFNSKSNTTSTRGANEDRSNIKIRPWLQVFNLGAIYNHAMIEKQIQAVEDVLDNGSTTSGFGGWLLWDPANNYKEF